jgi:hypothetical protein
MDESAEHFAGASRKERGRCDHERGTTVLAELAASDPQGNARPQPRSSRRRTVRTPSPVRKEGSRGGRRHLAFPQRATEMPRARTPERPGPDEGARIHSTNSHIPRAAYRRGSRVLRARTQVAPGDERSGSTISRWAGWPGAAARYSTPTATDVTTGPRCDETVAHPSAVSCGSCACLQSQTSTWKPSSTSLAGLPPRTPQFSIGGSRRTIEMSSAGTPAVPRARTIAS